MYRATARYQPLLEVRSLKQPPLLHEISFQLYPGEIIGIAGLMGSGRTELAQALFGITPPTAGSVWIDGQPVTVRSPRHALKHGLALIPENRRTQGLVLAHAVRDNLLLPLIALGRLTRWRTVVKAQQGEQIAQSFSTHLQIKMASLAMPTHLLSGGNQQKIVIAKWLSTDPRILIMDEPTAGVDIGTKLEIIETIRALAAQGKGIIVISSEMPELLALSDRIYVLRHGTFKAALPRQDIAAEEQLHHILQGDDV